MWLHVTPHENSSCDHMCIQLTRKGPPKKGIKTRAESIPYSPSKTAMLLSILSVALSTLSSVNALANPPVDKVVGGYVLFGDPTKLALLAQNAATLPVNRLWLSFVRPDMYYEPGSNTLAGVGLNYNNTQADFGFAEIKKYTQQLQAGGVEVFLSMGGWDYNCWPYAYAKYSIDNYSHSSPTYQSTIQKYGGGNFASCNEANQFCYACEPPSNGNTFDSFTIFPEPGNSALWKQAQDYVRSNNNLGVAPVWHPELLGGQKYNGFTVPGNPTWANKGRDPYEDLVLLAKDLGLDGVDIDYEEFWHADMFKTDSSAGKDCSKGDCSLLQTVFKFTAIMQDMRLAVQKHYPQLKVSTAASAAGAWAGTWWGGNHKGLSLNMVQAYPDLVQWIGSGANAGGWNVMSYDLSNDPKVGCPTTNAADCTLDWTSCLLLGITHQSLSTKLTKCHSPTTLLEKFCPTLNRTTREDSSGNSSRNKEPLLTCTLTSWPKISVRLSWVQTLHVALDLPTTVPITSPPNRPPPAGKPNCYPPFNATEQYKAESTVSYQGYNYKAKFWVNLGTVPGEKSANGEAWVQEALCKATGGATTTTTTTTTTAKPSTTTTTTTTTAKPTTTTAKPSTTTTTTTTTVKPTSTTTVKPTTTTTTTTVKPATTTAKPTTTTTTTTTTKAAATTTTSSGGPVVGQPCTGGESKCSANTMYYCLGSAWIVWYVGC
ncbi:hypothetical protein BDR26DRAFT_871523 [Obelidium mucronatum]|nr:hypothetical protein BDR26DRAFT_871523 [Obelidium mucronatum]